jgi:hypothetical protein
MATSLLQTYMAMARNESYIQLFPPTTTAAQSASPGQSPVSVTEAQFYYAGLPSHPLLIARSSSPTTPWMERGPEAYPQRKELKVVGNHALNNIWENTLAPLVLALLESEGVKWTSVDVVRIGNAGEASAPVILWIGVIPTSLSHIDGLHVALKCKELLQKNDIVDVDVELRESVVTRSGGPRFLDPAFLSDPTVEVRRPLTATLGLSICAESTAWAEGTGGFFMAEGGDSKRIFLITARHVVLLPGIDGNDKYEHRNPSQPRRNVLLLGDTSFRKLLTSTQVEIGKAAMMVEYHKGRLKEIEGMEGEAAERERRKAQIALDDAKEEMEAHQAHSQDVLKYWGSSENRVLGYVLFSPPIKVSVTADQHTEDFAIIVLKPSKIDAQNFKGNVIDLGTQIQPSDFILMMHPHPTNPRSFSYPPNRLLKLQGTISTAEMHSPRMLDQNGEPCLMVIKRGSATGLTIGCGNNILSYTRHYFKDAEPQTSMEWAVLPYDKKSGPFSTEGDSGAVIVDGLGRIGGLLTGGAGLTDTLDITYATPIDFLKQRIALKFPNAHLNPVLTA